MKSYNHLWEKLITDENIDSAIHKASVGKNDRDSVQRYLSAPNIHDVIREYAENYFNFRHKPVEIYDGITKKVRTIIVPTFAELIIQHMVVNVLEPIFMKGMYEHSYGSVPGRGAHKGKNVIKKWIAKGNCKYCLKMDIRKYFDSIPHYILLKKLRNLIHDDKFYNLIEKIVKITDVGIPLGFYLSQWLANWYLQGLDHYIKEVLHAGRYIRYVDDMVIFGPNKKRLHSLRKSISYYLATELGLVMKDNWQVFLFHYVKRSADVGRFLDFLGFRFYRNRITIRKSIMIRCTRTARRIGKKTKATIHDIRRMLSYFGWVDATNSYSMYLCWIKPYVNIQDFRRRISVFDRRENRRKNELDKSTGCSIAA